MKKLSLFILLTFLPFIKSLAQGCSVCTQTANQLGEEGANGLNTGIVYLALLPLTFICVLGFVWWKYNRRIKS